MACYEQFGWTYADITALPDYEARLLAIFFEERSQYTAEQHREISRSSSRSPAFDGEVTEEIGSDDDEEDE